MRALRRTLIGLVVVAATVAAPAGAATFTVSGFSDGKGACVGPVCPTLRAAVSAANANPGADEIDLQSGTFRIELGSETAEDANASGDLDVTGDLTIKGSGADATSILGALPPGDGERDIHVPGNANLTLAGVTVSGGRGGENEPYNFGGGIYSAGTGTLTLEHVVVSHNESLGKASWGDGGGVTKLAGRLVIRDSALLYNYACCGGYGGAIYLGGETTSAELINVTLAGNKAQFLGGALDSDAEGPVSLTFVTVMGNEAESEGGGLGNAADVHIRDTIIDGNVAPKGANCKEGPTSEGGNVADPACGLSFVSDAPVFDPVVGPLEGIPVPVLEPLTGSPALDRAVGVCPPEDARGIPRPQGPRCDSGAAERPVPVPVVSPPATGSGPPPPPPPSAAQIRAGLLAQLLPKGHGATIAALLKRGYALRFNALTAGVLTIGWYYLPKGAHLARAKPQLVAAAKATFAAPGTTTVQIRLTPRGRTLLRHARRLAVTAKGTFVPAGGPAALAVRAFTLKR